MYVIESCIQLLPSMILCRVVMSVCKMLGSVCALRLWLPTDQGICQSAKIVVLEIRYYPTLSVFAHTSWTAIRNARYGSRNTAVDRRRRIARLFT